MTKTSHCMSEKGTPVEIEKREITFTPTETHPRTVELCAASSLPLGL